ncbi:isoprenylcysteine carboxyl methyltransferase (ICMT) family protein [Peptococcaceae bacterium CEB3]|nr:isoprenylcysteine carboxyl methyltransferase (ICMT) family protein [Peptococcaceae bacterium CEB3]
MLYSASVNLFQFGIGLALIVLNLRHGFSGLLFIPFVLSESIQMLLLLPGMPWKAPLQAIHARPADVIIALLSANFWLIWNIWKPVGGTWATSGWVSIPSAMLYVLGFALSLVSTIYLYPSFSVLPERRKLVTDGPYKVIKHPIYTGYVLMALGQSAAGGSLFMWLGFVLSSGLYCLRAKREEKVLTMEG